MNTTNNNPGMTGVVARHVIDTVCDMADLEPDAVRAEYSGRGMHGQRCFGVVMAPDEVAGFREALSAATTPNIGLSWADASVDSLGMDVIVYFPGWRLADEPAPPSAAPTDAGASDAGPSDAVAPHVDTGRSAAGCEEEWAVWSDEATADPNDEAALLRVRADRADAMEWAATYGRRRRVARRVITRSRWIPVTPDRTPCREAPDPGGNRPGGNGSATRPPNSSSAPVVSHHAPPPRTPDGGRTDGVTHPDRRVAREVIAAVCAAAEITPDTAGRRRSRPGRAMARRRRALRRAATVPPDARIDPAMDDRRRPAPLGRRGRARDLPGVGMGGTGERKVRRGWRT
jgi:hypothetical protein